jgi:hypothetical protein
MGGKGGGSQPVYTTPTSVNTTSVNSNLDSALSGMTSANALLTQQLMAQQQQTIASKMPDVTEAPKVDWASESEKLAAKVKTSSALEQAKKVGRTQTIISSPLLDDESAQTTFSSLIGS